MSDEHTSSQAQTLASKRTEWLTALNGTDRNSIVQQLRKMAWNATVFMIVNEARRLAPTDAQGRIQQNGVFHRFIDDCFLDSQLASIRRLHDASPGDGDKGVFSLTRLILDMQIHASLLTRQSILEAEGLLYDYRPAKEEELRRALEHAETVGGVFYSSSQAGFSELRHEHIDRLSGVLPRKRSPNDAVRTEVLARLGSKVAYACNDAKHYVDKFIAHAAIPGSRAVLKADEIRFSLNSLRNAHMGLSQVAGFLSVFVLGGPELGSLPFVDFDQFEHLDQPLASAKSSPELRRLWTSIDAGYHQWGQWSFDEYAAEFGAPTI